MPTGGKARLLLIDTQILLQRKVAKPVKIKDEPNATTAKKKGPNKVKTSKKRCFLPNSLLIKIKPLNSQSVKGFLSTRGGNTLYNTQLNNKCQLRSLAVN